MFVWYWENSLMVIELDLIKTYTSSMGVCLGTADYR